MIDILVFEVGAWSNGARLAVVKNEIDVLCEDLHQSYGVKLHVRVIPGIDETPEYGKWLSGLDLKAAPFSGSFPSLNKLMFIARTAGLTGPAKPTILCLPEDVELSELQHAHGFCSDKTVVLKRYYAQIIFHEFLHMFGVLESYEPDSKKPILGCSDCWMQWEASFGHLLSEPRVEELKQYLRENPEWGALLR